MEKELNGSEVVTYQVGQIVSLAQVDVGTSGTIKAVQGEGRIRRRLFDMGLTPGAELFVRKRAPLGDPIELTLRGYELTVRHAEAEFVQIQITDLAEKGGPHGK